MRPQIVIVLGLLLSAILAVPLVCSAEPNLTAEAAILMDYATGEIIYQKNADIRRYPASTTKILTAIVAIERGDLSSVITTGVAATKAGGSSMYLSKGERHTLEELLYGILLPSGNDASVAVAEGLAGSESKFVEWMNIKANAIGAKNSNFENCNGLPNNNHYTTAYDLALITRYALHNPLFSEIVRTKKKEVPWPNHKTDRVMYNHNKLLWRYEFADGVKTGYTRQAGHCLVTSATKDGQRLIAVVLKSKQTYTDSKELFDYGFNNYKLVTLVRPGSKIAEANVENGIVDQVPVLPNEPLQLVLPKSVAPDLKVNLAYQKDLVAPVERLQEVGHVEIKLGEKILDRIPLVTATAVPEKSFWAKMWDWVKELLT